VNKILQKIPAVILSLVIVVSTSGLNLYGHFCGCCQIYEVSVTAFDENCCDEKLIMFAQQITLMTNPVAIDMSSLQIMKLISATLMAVVH